MLDLILVIVDVFGLFFSLYVCRERKREGGRDEKRERGRCSNGERKLDLFKIIGRERWGELKGLSLGVLKM